MTRISQRGTDSTHTQIIIYARYSREEQNADSIPAQVSLCKRWLAAHGYGDTTPIVLSDEAISGEVLHRDGVEKVKQLLQGHTVLLLIVEDLGRLFRDQTFLGLLLKLARDCGTKIVGVNEGFDSDDPDAALKLLISGFHHQQHNSDAARRITRAAEERWDRGYLMYDARPGYKKVPVDEELYRTKGRGPYREVRDDEMSPIIHEAFERIARGDRIRSVVKFLNESKMRKHAKSRISVWTLQNVCSLIHNSLYMGEDTWQFTRSQKVELDGRHVPVKNDADKVRVRQMPHLAHVSRELWHRANEMLRTRAKAFNPSGTDNPMYGRTREKRTLLGTHLQCDVCGGPIVGQGRKEGGYRCRNATRDECWNLSSVIRTVAEEKIFAAVTSRLLLLDGIADALVEFSQNLCRADGGLKEQIGRLEQRKKTVEKEAERYTKAIALADDQDIQSLVEERQKRQTERLLLNDQLESLSRQSNAHVTVPTRAELLAAADGVTKALLAKDEDAGQWLRRLTSTIRLRPMGRIDGGAVVVRARFRLDLAALLPGEIQQLVFGTGVDTSGRKPLSEDIEVLLSTEPYWVENAKKVVEMQKAGTRRDDIAAMLGVPVSMIDKCLRFGKLMERLGQNEPYVAWSERPDENTKGVRWKYRTDYWLAPT